ncbi:MAG: hypothetical protein KatS3mg115_0465 [Candidatus Poribacteria bacterium]|nr:MAG: hypothetical protein KatS3mg115_0465 [Candidatus Poribacteria bacterium]
MWIVRIAFRNLLRQRRRTVLTGLMVTVGYLLCSLSLGLGKGTYASIIEFFTSYRTGHVQIHARGYRDAPSLYATVDRWREIGKRLETVPEVIAWAPRVLAPALAFSDAGKTSGVQLFGLDPAQEAATTTLPRRLLRGKWLADGEADNRVLVDEGLARLLRLEVGSAVYLIGEGADGSIANDVFEVIGIVQGAGGFAERNVYLPLPAAQRFLVLGDRVHELVLRTRKTGGGSAARRSAWRRS